ncbi:MAG: hercynine oxygenase [Gemmatales bacterium]|nr:MAG: hercynine oxygenase [Gemmatales bacterium]
MDVVEAPEITGISPATLVQWLMCARQRTLASIEDLSDEQLIGPQLEIVNPLLWEIGHLAWFYEKWLLREGGKLPSLRADADALYDSISVHHDSRWRLPLPSRRETLAYMQQVLDRVVDIVDAGPTPRQTYFVLLSLFHEDMHVEAFAYSRQTLGYPPPSYLPAQPIEEGSPWPGDVEIAGGTYVLGARRGTGFVFDNEKWAHEVELKPFKIARAAVTQAEFAAFVDDGGYLERRWWDDEGWNWRTQQQAEHPVYWRKEGGCWQRRHFDQWVGLEPHCPMLHVNWYEAQAYCRWAKRRLPTEAEWECAARGFGENRRFPWGDDLPTKRHANVDAFQPFCVAVSSCPAGDSWAGCRQMIGNVWEWTASPFLPYPGFSPDPYREYSVPWFKTHKVLRGGCWLTPARTLRNTWRNYYLPHRRDVWAGFRTCSLES